MFTDDTSSTGTGPAQSPVNPPTPPTTDNSTDDSGSGKETDWKAEARKWETRAKANQDASTKLQQLEDANKSELQKSQDQTVAEKARGDAAENELRRYKAAVKYKLSDEDIDLLGNGTDDEIDTRAKRLAALSGQQQKPRKPSPDPAQGTGGGDGAATPAAAFAEVWGQLT